MADKPNNDTYKWRAIGIVMIGTFMAILDSSIVNVAIPHMMASFGTDLEKMKWVATAYMIAYGVIVLTTDFLGSRFGHERVYVAALGLFTIGSFLCGQAWDINSMISFRAFQAVGGGLMLPTGMTIITKAFKPEERGTAFGVFGMVILIAPVLGPTLGGYLVDQIGWPSIFLINIPVGIAAFPWALASLHFSPMGKSRPFDWLGFFGLGTALTALLIALSQGERWGWNSEPIVTCFVLSALGFFVFIVADLYTEYPIIDLSLFSNLAFSLICIMSFLRSISLFGRTLFLSLFMQTIMGYSATSAGLYLIPGAIVAGICTPIFGKLTDRFGSKPLIIPGFIITGWSLWLYHDLSPESPYSHIFWPMILFGVGMAALSSPMMSSAMNVVHPRQIGMVSILQTVIMQIGGAYGINYLETVVDARTTFHLQSMMIAFTSSISNFTGHWVTKLTNSLALSGTAFLKIPGGLKAVGISLYNQMQAAAWAYDDAFIIMAALCFISAIIALFFKEKRAKAPSPEAKAEADVIEAV